MANLLSELERFEQEMKELGSEPTSSLAPPPHLVARVPMPAPPPPPPSSRLSTSLSSRARLPPCLPGHTFRATPLLKMQFPRINAKSPTVPLLPNTNGVIVPPALGTLPRVLPPTPVRTLPPRPSPTLATGPGGIVPSPPPVAPVGNPMPWLKHGASATSPSSSASIPSVSPSVSHAPFTYSQPPTSLTPSTAVPPSSQPAVVSAAPSSSYFPVPFHLQQQPQSYQQPQQQYQPQSYQQGPVQYSSQSTAQQSQPQATQSAVVQGAAQSSYQYQAGYQPSGSAAAATPVSAAPEIFAMPQQQQAQQLFQRDAQTITPEALESVKAALASGEGEHKSEARKRAVPRKAAGMTWEDPTLADWPENDHRLFCGDLGNEVNDEVLTKAFTRFASFNMARVVRDKRTGKTKGYGFVSFTNPSDLALAFKEMNGKYVGNRPIKLRKSTWKERTDQEAFEKQKNSKRQKSKKSLLHK